MVIQTLGKQYYVIQHCFSDSNQERFVCLCENNREKYTVVRVNNKAWIVNAVKFLMEQMENDYFTDFVSCFMSEDCLHVVMKYAEGISLKEKLEKETCSLEERMVIGRSILDRIMLLNMPDYFLTDCLKDGTIILSHGLEARFQYELSGLNEYHKAAFATVQTSLYQVFRFLFSEEINGRGWLSLEQFCASLKAKQYQERMEIYTAYDELCKTMQSMGQKKQEAPYTWGFHMLEKIKGLISVVKKAIAVGLMLLAVIFLLYEIRESFQEGQEKKLFETVGTLHIEAWNGE